MARNVRQTFHFVRKSREFFRKSQLHQQPGNDQWSSGNQKGVNLYFWGGWRIWKRRMRMNTAIARTCLNIFTIGLLNIWNMKPSPILFQHNTLNLCQLSDAEHIWRSKSRCRALTELQEGEPTGSPEGKSCQSRSVACEIVINSAAPQLLRLPGVTIHLVQFTSSASSNR